MWTTALAKAGHLFRFGLGNGASTAVSLLLSIVLARRLDAPAFEVVNLTLVAGSMVANAGGGVDAAAARLLARDQVGTQSLVGMVITCRAFLGLLLLPLGVASVLWAGVGSQVAVAAAILLVCTQALGIVVTQISIIEPIVRGRPGTYTVRQLAYFTPLLLLALIFVHSGADVLWLTLPGPALLLVFARRRMLASPRRPSRSFVNMAAYLVASSILFALYDRIDLVVAAQRFDDDVGAAYGVAYRAAGFYVLVTSTLATVLVPIVSSIVAPVRLRQIVRRTGIEIALACGVLALGAALLPVAIPIVFGESYRAASSISAAMAPRYILMAIYLPAAIVMPLLARPRHYFQMTVLQAASVAVAVALAHSPTELALAPAIAPVAGLSYALLLLRRGRARPL